MRAAVLSAMLVLVVAGCGPAGPALPKPPHLRHVFVVVLENTDYAQSFGNPANAPYLARTLRSKGVLLWSPLPRIAHLSLPNYLAMVSGRGPTLSTTLDCPVFGDVHGASTAAVHPLLRTDNRGPAERTRADSWRAYLQDMARP